MVFLPAAAKARLPILRGASMSRHSFKAKGWTSVPARIFSGARTSWTWSRHLFCRRPASDGFRSSPGRVFSGMKTRAPKVFWLSHEIWFRLFVNFTVYWFISI